MSAIIYETINVYNKENNILPYKYLGSDQHNKPEYLGSSKSLLKDIKKLGKQFFIKVTICEFKEDMSNILLRKIESQIQRHLDVANNPEYYNKTNNSHKGYIETDEEKRARMAKTHMGYKIWWESLTDIEKQNHRLKCTNKSTKGKTYEEIYGKEKALLKKQKHCGKNNGRSKQILDIKTGRIFETILEAMNFYGIKGYSTIHRRCVKEKGIKFI